MTQSLVVDASVTVKLLIPNEEHSHLKQLFQQWVETDTTLYAPTLWAYELTSALNKLVHFKQLVEEEARQTMHLAHNLDIQLVAPTPEHVERAFTWTRDLNRAAAYDSFYLALAESLGCQLWTADKRLANAVDVSWIRLAGQP